MSDKPILRKKALRPDAAPEVPPSAPAPEAAPSVPDAATPRPRPTGPRREHNPNAPAPTPLAPGQIPVSERLAELDAIAGLASIDMEAILGAAPLRGLTLTPGARVQGTVTSISHDDLQVDLGARSTGFLPRRELGDLHPKVGDVIDVWVVSADDLGVQLSVRLSGAAAAAHLEEAAEAGIPVEGQVLSRNNGGYEVRIGTSKAFCPISQMSRVPLADPDSVVGQTLPFRVLETSGKIVVSRRALEEADAAADRERFWQTAHVGDEVIATITNVQPWAAFVDVGGVDARLPKREVGWEEIDDLTTRLVRGQRITVRIVDIDALQNKVTVSARDPSLDPWKAIDDTLRVGDVRTGRVISQTDYGVFIEVSPGVHGLLHARRLVGDAPAPGTTASVRLTRIDAAARRIELASPDWEPSANPEPTESDDRAGVGTVLQGMVEHVEPGGVRLRLPDGRTGWLPGREVELAPGQQLAHRFRAGFPAEVRIKADAGGRLTFSQLPDEGEDRRAWQQQANQQQQASLGTMADLFAARLKKR